MLHSDDSGDKRKTGKPSSAPAAAPDASSTGSDVARPSNRSVRSQSDKRKGRRRGALNTGNLLKQLINEVIEIKVGEEHRRMPVIKAIMHVLTSQSLNGDASAPSTLMDVYAMTGQMEELSDDAKRQRQMRLPVPLSPEEYDLLKSPARERERQRYLAIAREAESYQLAAAGRRAEALALVLRDLEEAKARWAREPGKAELQAALDRAVVGLGLLADAFLLAGEFARARQWAERALADGRDEQQDALRWLAVIRIHALMFLGAVEAARDFYLQLRHDKHVVLTSWQTVVLQDFARLRAGGHAHPLMAEIETRFAAEGWTMHGPYPQDAPPDAAAAAGSATASTRAPAPVRGHRQRTALRHGDREPSDTLHAGAAATALNASQDAEPSFLLTGRDDLEAGDLLAARGELNEAATVYRRNLSKYEARQAKDPGNADAQAKAALAAKRIGELASKFIAIDGFARALDCADQALAYAPRSDAPEWLGVTLSRAVALMFLGRAEEARPLFAACRGTAADATQDNDLVLQALRQLHVRGRTHPLMHDIAQEFGVEQLDQGTSDERPADLAKTSSAGSAFDARPVDAKAVNHHGETAPRSVADISAGDALLAQGKFTEALAVYRRHLEVTREKIASNPADAPVQRELEATRRGVDDLAFRLLQIPSRARQALAVVEEALSDRPDCLRLHMLRAHALLLSANVTGARNIHKENSKLILPNGERWGTMLRRDFAALRAAGVTHHLMQRFEEEYAGEP
jgi:tetratricopeptide (TPR) repeat protein